VSTEEDAGRVADFTVSMRSRIPKLPDKVAK